MDVEAVDSLVAERHEARKKGDHLRFNEIERYLRSKGIIVEDGPLGTIWYRKQIPTTPPEDDINDEWPEL